MRQAFSATPDLDLYVPRPATEQAVLAFEHALFERVGAVASLCGRPGIGKSMVLGRVAQRLAGLATCVVVEYGGLAIPELCKWVLRELHSIDPDLEADPSLGARIRSWFRRVPDETVDPEGALVARATLLAAHGRPLVMLIDAADEMPDRGIRALAKLSADAEGALFVGIATSTGAVEDRAHLAAVELAAPMTLKETETYIDSRLARAGAPSALRAQLDADTIAQIHEYAEGNPRRVHGEISLIQIALEQEGLLEPDTDPAPDLPAARAFDAPVIPIAQATRAAPAMPAPSLPESAQRPTRAAPRERPRSRGRLWLVPAGAAALASAVWLIGSDGPAPGEDRQGLAEIDVSAPLPEVPRRAPLAPAKATSDEAIPTDEGLAADERDPMPEAEVAPRELTTLNVNARPWATIFIDGEEIGVTPIGGYEIAKGKYRIQAILPDGRNEERVVEVDGPSAVVFE